jgi:hypothetical protein
MAAALLLRPHTHGVVPSKPVLGFHPSHFGIGGIVCSRGFQLGQVRVLVAFQAHMAWFGWVYYSLTAFRILFCTLRVVGMHRMARDLKQDAKLKLAALRNDPDNDRDQLARHIRLEKLYYRSYDYGAACFAWHAMTLLRVMEHGSSLRSPCSTWLTWGFGISIRLILIHSHLSYGGWLV